MRNLAVFIVRHYFFLFFLLLELLSLYFLVQRNYFHHTSAVSASNSITVSIFQARSEISEYLDLKEQNKILSAKLAAQLNQKNTSWMLFSSHVTSYNDSVYKQRYEYLAAEVIDNTVTLRNNYIILNRGSLQGVLPDMGVVCADGIVGIVRDVSENYCIVMSILHSDTKISASLKRDGSFGKLTWNGLGSQYATLADLPDFSKIKKGDTLISSGLGDAFPEGIPVGVVEKFEFKSGEKTYSVEVRLATNFRKLRHAFVVKNLLREELDQLRIKAGVEDGE